MNLQTGRAPACRGDEVSVLVDEDTSIWVDPGVGSGLVLIVDQPDLRLTVELDRTTAGELCEVLAAVMDELEGAAGQVGDGE